MTVEWVWLMCMSAGRGCIPLKLRSIDSSARTYFLAFDIRALGLVNECHGKVHTLLCKDASLGPTIFTWI
jgi:hypothetical protein